MRKVNWLKLVLCILIIEGIGSLSALFAGDIKGVYRNLNTPPLSPPSWVFGVAWSLIFALLGIAVYRILQTEVIKKTNKINALAVFAVQLLVNFMWSILFFRFQLFWLSTALVIVLAALVIWSMNKFKSIDRLSGYLFIPYLCWLVFATYLAAGCAILN